ncbi:MAG: NAD(P)H-dependent oxidoreductase [Candidatus Moraniibacteriota bacterium]|nr:MAG: NAD(P)H-dependent oxidoreductase [Candidatus Moranbacteria bacterium]
MSQSKLHVSVIAGSTREGRFSDKAARWIASEAAKRSGVSVEVLDLRDYEMPFFDDPVSPSYKNEPYAHEAVARFTEKIAASDVFIMVTPEYNHGTSGVLKNALDWVYREWNNKSVGFVSYGSVGGARAVEQLRLNSIELQMAPIRESIHIPGERYFPVAMGESSAEELLTSLEGKAKIFLDQLLWWGKALKDARE